MVALSLPIAIQQPFCSGWLIVALFLMIAASITTGTLLQAVFSAEIKGWEIKLPFGLPEASLLCQTEKVAE